MEESKVVEFPNNVANQEMSPQDQEVFARLEPMMESQDQAISELVNQACRGFDVAAQAAEGGSMPIFVPMEAGLAISATYLNMVSDEQGSPIEAVLDTVQELTQVISKVTDEFFDKNPETPTNVYYYALIHAASSSLRHQRLLNNVGTIREELKEGNE